MRVCVQGGGGHLAEALSQYLAAGNDKVILYAYLRFFFIMIFYDYWKRMDLEPGKHPLSRLHTLCTDSAGTHPSVRVFLCVTFSLSQ